MSTLDKFQAILQKGETTTVEALALFDDLDTVTLDFIMGRWKGSGFRTNHRIDGLLETIGWYGKDFIDPDCVHPLLFSDGPDDGPDDGSRIYKVAPNPIAVNLGFSLDLPKKKTLKPLYRAMSKLLKTEESKASVRMMEYRGKLSATMIYDYLPIHDVFRRVDDNTLLGLMDFKKIEQPFFFVLKRAQCLSSFH
ncbi:MAG: DUF4334 domain-containing protein [Cyanobacteria bacterium P01_D01_bin.56]